MDWNLIEQKLESLRRSLRRIEENAVGFRNLTVHQYEAINWAIVHSIAKYRLTDFTEFARAIANMLPNS